MRKIAVLMLAVLLLPVLAAAETWSNVPLVDASCASQAKANPDAHPRACALQCQKAGFGVLTPKGDFLKFDFAGNRRALELLEHSAQRDHLRVTVTGERTGDTIKVQSLSL